MHIINQKSNRCSSEPTQSGLIHFSSKTDEWSTPKEVIPFIRRVLPVIDLDPCSDAAQTIPAKNRYFRNDDGLSRKWRGRVYLNPPYGRQISNWVGRLVRLYNEGDVTESIALLPARTDTIWFRLLRDHSRVFVSGRLKFGNSDHSAPFPSVFVYLGQNQKLFVSVFSKLGDVYSRINPPKQNTNSN